MFRYLVDKVFGSLKHGSAPTHTLPDKMSVDPSKYDIQNLVPVILPSSVRHSTWPGPVTPIGDLPFVVTWALMEKPGAFIYVTQAMQAHWESAGLDWRAEAMKNLRQRVESDPPVAGKLDRQGAPFLVALLTPDSIGPSRLLVPDLLNSLLGRDYLVAIPEQTCAIAYRVNLAPEYQEIVDAVVDGCFERGTEPMSPERYPPDKFWVL